MMKNMDMYIPSAESKENALAKTTHLAIGAHQDDLEIMAFHGISECYQVSDSWFGGIVVTDGAGSARTGSYAKYNNSEMTVIRQQEQRAAADIGEYSIVIQCCISSGRIKQAVDEELVNQLAEWLGVIQPQTIYLHNLMDRHHTHVAVAVHALEALRRLPKEKLPHVIYGVEGWRNLDWLPSKYRIELDVSQNRQLFGELIRVFDSQVSGGKRYDLAVDARQLVNATFGDSHSVDTAKYVSLAVDLMPLIENSQLSYEAAVASLLKDFEGDLNTALTSYATGEQG